MNNCGISRWDDPNEINARLKALTSQPIWEVTDEYYNNVILNYFDEKCKASKAVYEESKEYIPGGVQHNLAFNKPFPMCMARADGAYLYDKDGNRYIDFLQAGGPTILGSNYPVIREKVIELLNECGPVTGLLHESELMIAKEINKHMPNVEMFRMLGSGTEAEVARPAREAARLMLPPVTLKSLMMTFLPSLTGSPVDFPSSLFFSSAAAFLSAEAVFCLIFSKSWETLF